MIPKFRAYSVEENIMYYPDEDKNVEWTIDDDTGFIAPHVNLGNCMWGMIDKYILMQSTGLKDKNGVEIFEGDIIKLQENHTSYYVVEWHKKGMWIFRLIENKNQYYTFETIYSFSNRISNEIIGNIYENPDLLEKESEEE